jgi:hypothetical protein
VVCSSGGKPPTETRQPTSAPPARRKSGSTRAGPIVGRGRARRHRANGAGRAAPGDADAGPARAVVRCRPDDDLATRARALARHQPKATGRDSRRTRDRPRRAAGGVRVSVASDPRPRSPIPLASTCGYSHTGPRGRRRGRPKVAQADRRNMRLFAYGTQGASAWPAEGGPSRPAKHAAIRIRGATPL